jgi:hypothetical protein
VKPHRVFAILALLPLIALGALALIGARAHVGVVTTGSGEHLALGAAWVAIWLLAVIGSPIAAVAAAVSYAITRVASRERLAPSASSA